MKISASAIKWIKALTISIIAIFAPIQTVLGAALALIMIDLVTGVAKAIKAKEKITSSGLRRTITKIVVYEIALMVAFLAEKYLIMDAVPVVKLVSSMVGLVEVKSIFENLNGLSSTGLLTSLLGKLNSQNLEDEK